LLAPPAEGDSIAAATVVCAPGIAHFTNLPDWAERVPPGQATHTCDFVRLEELSGRRVLIVGGRQSAYEWAALAREHGAERIDIVHRHDVPRFERVCGRSIEAHVQGRIEIPGSWRNLPEAQQTAIAQRFWEVGRLTLEDWLTPRLDSPAVHRWPGTEVTEVAASGSAGELQVVLSNSERLVVDQVVFASGYRADLTRVPYLPGLMPPIHLPAALP